jgi:hypothetical protein
MAQQFRTGRDCDGWCTRCKMDLAHTIVAMVDGLPVKVECNTCGSLHKFYHPRAERDAAKAARAAARAVKKTSSGKNTKRTSGGSSKVREIWAQRMESHGGDSQRLYTIRDQYEVDEVLEHTKFGRGVVTKLISALKMRVLFEDGEHVLAMGR